MDYQEEVFDMFNLFKRKRLVVPLRLKEDEIAAVTSAFDRAGYKVFYSGFGRHGLTQAFYCREQCGSGDDIFENRRWFDFWLLGNKIENKLGIE